MITDPSTIDQVIDRPAPPGQIVITHDRNTRASRIDVQGISEGDSIAVLAGCMHAIWMDSFNHPLRPGLPKGKTKVCIQFDEGKLSMSFGTQEDGGVTADPEAAQALMVAALFGLADQLNHDKFEPLQALLGNLYISMEDDSGKDRHAV